MAWIFGKGQKSLVAEKILSPEKENRKSFIGYEKFYTFREAGNLTPGNI